MSDGPLPDRPKIKDKCELGWRRDTPVLLYPEGVVKLNRSGYEILELTDGELTLDQIADALEERHGQENLREEIRSFLTDLWQEGLLADAG